MKPKVIMFHSIGNESNSWYRSWLSVSLTHFEEFCKYLQKKQYSTLFLDEWYYFQGNPKEQTGKEIVLTFDDGYLDNWVYAYPILKKYGLKGTVFINPEFVDPSNSLRSNIEDVWEGRANKESIETLGFLSWPEIQKMDADGVIQAQSHSMSHNFYFYTDKLIDFYFGQPKYDWLAWFLAPERKPFYITESQQSLVPFGYPIFENYRALGLQRFFPSNEFVNAITQKAKTLIEEKHSVELIKEQLYSFSEEFKKENGSLGHYETDKEMENRYRYELFESKKILEEKVKHPVDFLCWPGGGYNELSVKLSIDAGYKASTIASREPTTNIDNKGHYKRIPRVGTGSFIHTKKGLWLIKDPRHLALTFIARNGNLLLRVLLKIRKILIQWQNRV